jgi:polyribonucleotide nucleotidyltransferase
MIDALAEAERVVLEIIDLANELVDRCAKPAMEFTAPSIDEDLKSRVFEFEGDLADAMKTDGKHERGAAMSEVKKKAVAALTSGLEGDDLKAQTKAVKDFFGDLKKHCERSAIISGRRVDGREWDEIRQITVVPNFNERQHGSVLFTRGETQALVSATLGTPDDEQIIDGVEEEYKKHFYLHYNFPAYSVGETRRIMGPGRREIGHGMLAERSLNSVLPEKESFPYTIRVVSDITESNGSSSMASVCGGCLSMMLAGVPLTQPVAGIAMGLVQEGDKTAILSDILGSEDHSGDMDFKVAGSGVGITALQMDIKIKGVSRDLLENALEQAKKGRIHILRKMLEAVPAPSSEVSRFAPRMETIKIPSDRIGFLIGPGGKNIRQLQADYGVRISIVDDEGHVQIYGTDADKTLACRDAISATMETPEIGSKYKGTVKSVRDFGAFIEILPGVEALCHISELGEGFIEQVSDVVNVGDEIEVVIINVDDRGKIKVSHKALTQPKEEGGDGEGGGDDRPRRGDRDRGRDDGERGGGGRRRRRRAPSR